MTQVERERLREFTQKLREEGTAAFADGPWDDAEKKGEGRQQRKKDGAMKPSRQTRQQTLGDRILNWLAILSLIGLIVGVAGTWVSYQREPETSPTRPERLNQTSGLEHVESRLTRMEKRLSHILDPYIRTLNNLSVELGKMQKQLTEHIENAGQLESTLPTGIEERLENVEQRLAATDERMQQMEQQRPATTDRMQSDEQLMAAEERLKALEQQRTATDERLQTLEQQRTATEERLQALDQQRAEAAEERLQALEQQRTATDERLQALEQQRTATEERLQALDQQRTEAAEERLQALNQLRAEATDERLQALDQQREAADARMQNLEELLAASAERMQELEQQRAAADARMQSLEELLAASAERMQELEQQRTAADARMDTLSVRLTALADDEGVSTTGTEQAARRTMTARAGPSGSGQGRQAAPPESQATASGSPGVPKHEMPAGAGPETAVPATRQQVAAEPAVSRTDASEEPQELAPAPKAETRPKPAKPAAAGTATGDWVINVASYTNERIARRKVAQMQQKGIDVELVTAEVRGKTIYRARVFGFASRREAESQAVRIRKILGIGETWITKR
jgi:chromosome segregation ATPase